jgi:raffinose/stachyose/melibiose transport system substrate-binding protein
MQAGSAPDIFNSWGGGVLAEQAEAGMARPIEDEIADWKDTMNAGAMSPYQVDGVQYGIPYNFGLVGFWYNQDLFAEAGIEEPPATWDEFLEDVQALKDAGITPIALAAGDKWPAMFYWAYLALRAGGQAAMEEAISTGDWTGPAFIEAGEQFKRLVDLEPFQEGYLAAAYNADQASTMGNGKAAMELMGQWAPGVEVAESESGEGIGDALGWFPFPAVEGGAGLPTDIFGGGDGYAVGKDAPPEAVDFIRFLSSEEIAERFGATNTGILPPTEAAVDSVTDPTLQTLLQKRAEATFAQLYLDQATSPALGAAINDAIQLLVAGQASPEDVSTMITDAAAME